MEILLTLLACFGALAIDQSWAILLAYGVAFVSFVSIVCKTHKLRNQHE